MAKRRFLQISGFKGVVQKVKNFIGIFQGQVDDMASRNMRRGAVKFAKEVVTVIKKQRYKWKPLSERWLRYKKKNRLDPRVHVATKTYVKSIKATPRKRNGKVVSWGVTAGQPNQIHKPSGMRFVTLARLLEFGSRSRNMPPRPHWRPAWSAFVRRDKKLLARNIIREAYKAAVEKVKSIRR